MAEHEDLLAVARDAAKQAARYIRSAERPSRPDDWDSKGVSDFVTAVDRSSERLIAQILRTQFPHSTIVGEELSPAGQQAQGLCWIVDPLDGTTNFLHDYPAYAVSIAAAQDGELVAGVVVDVCHDTEYHATAGAGAWCGEMPLRVSDIDDPAHALVGTGFPFKSLEHLPEYLGQLGTILRRTSGIRRAGSAALDLVDVARGRFDGFWELALAPWDVAAGTLLVREAGGRVTGTDGRADVLRQGPIVAGNPTIHAWLMGIVGGA